MFQDKGLWAPLSDYAKRAWENEEKKRKVQLNKGDTQSAKAQVIPLSISERSSVTHAISVFTESGDSSASVDENRNALLSIKNGVVRTAYNQRIHEIIPVKMMDQFLRKI